MKIPNPTLAASYRTRLSSLLQAPAAQLGLWLALALGGRVFWAAYTGYLAEDAFITFRYARNLADGLGFVYNPGEPLYGTTTPLLTLLLAAWLKLSGADLLVGARLFDFASAAGTFTFLWLALRRQPDLRPAGFFVMIVLALTPKLWSKDTQGMETPLVVMLMAASWYTYARGSLKWTGFLCGLLLWARIDTFLWPLSLAVLSLPSLKKTFILLVLTALTYLPWVLFASWYFGSPIPHTVTAKWIVYIQPDATPLGSHLKTVLGYLPPFYNPEGWASFTWVLGGCILLLAALGALTQIRNRAVAALALFTALEIARLMLTRATFFTRYFVPALWGVLILLGLLLGWLWARQQRTHPTLGRIYAAVLTIGLLGMALSSLIVLDTQRDIQQVRHEGGLKAIGIWLDQNTPPKATVLLEPLGYVGYYAKRPMLDEVGLVTPSVLVFKRQMQLDVYQYLPTLQPDYILAHCDDSLRWQERAVNDPDGFTTHYSLAATFNPHHFDPLNPGEPGRDSALARDACYEIWGPRH